MGYGNVVISICDQFVGVPEARTFLIIYVVYAD